jgi:hypothetical protein
MQRPMVAVRMRAWGRLADPDAFIDLVQRDAPMFGEVAFRTSVVARVKRGAGRQIRRGSMSPVILIRPLR